MQTSVISLLQEAMGWLHILPPLAGAVVCSLHLARSRWVGVLLAGFAGEAAVVALYRIGALLMARGVVSYAGVGGLFLLASLLGLAASTAIVAGVWGLLTPSRGSASPGPAIG